MYFSFNLQNFRFEIFSCKAPWAYKYGAIEILIIIVIIIIIIIIIVKQNFFIIVKWLGALKAIPYS